MSDDHTEFICLVAVIDVSTESSRMLLEVFVSMDDLIIHLIAMFHKGYKNQELNDFVLALNPTRLVMRLGILLLPALFSLAVSSNVNFQKPLTLPVDEKGTVFGYFDSGVPPHNPKTYNTIFAIHGLGFTSGRSAIHINTTKKIVI